MLRKAMDRIKKFLEIDDLHPHMFRYSHANQATTANIYIKNTRTMTDRAEAILSDFASANASNFIFLKSPQPRLPGCADYLAGGEKIGFEQSDASYFLYL